MGVRGVVRLVQEVEIVLELQEVMVGMEVEMAVGLVPQECKT